MFATESDSVDKREVVIGALATDSPFSNSSELEEDQILTYLVDKCFDDNYSISYMYYATPSALIEALEKGTVDIAFPMASYEVKGTNYILSDRVYSEEYNFVYKGNNDAKQDVIAVCERGLSSIHIQDVYPDCDKFYCETPKKCIEAIDRGDADFTIVNDRDLEILKPIMDEHRRFHSSEMVLEVDICFAANKNNKSLLNTINKQLKGLSGFTIRNKINKIAKTNSSVEKDDDGGQTVGLANVILIALIITVILIVTVLVILIVPLFKKSSKAEKNTENNDNENNEHKEKNKEVNISKATKELKENNATKVNIEHIEKKDNEDNKENTDIKENVQNTDNKEDKSLIRNNQANNSQDSEPADSLPKLDGSASTAGVSVDSLTVTDTVEPMDHAPESSVELALPEKKTVKETEESVDKQSEHLGQALEDKNSEGGQSLDSNLSSQVDAQNNSGILSMISPLPNKKNRELELATAQLEEKLKEQEEMLKKKDDELIQLRIENAYLQQENEESHDIAKDMQEKKDKAEQELDIFRKELLTVKRENENLQQDYASLKKERDEVLQDLEEIKKQHDSIQDICEEIQDRTESLILENADVQKRAQKIQREYDALRRQSDDLNRKNSSMKMETAALENVVAEKNRELEVIERQIAEKEMYLRENSSVLSSKAEEVNMRTAIKDILPRIQEKMEIASMNFALSIGAIGDTKVLCDKEVLNSVIYNILTSSIRYSQRKGKISLDITQTGRQNNNAIFEYTCRYSGQTLDFSSDIASGIGGNVRITRSANNEVEIIISANFPIA